MSAIFEDEVRAIAAGLREYADALGGGGPAAGLGRTTGEAVPWALAAIAAALIDLRDERLAAVGCDVPMVARGVAAQLEESLLKLRHGLGDGQDDAVEPAAGLGRRLDPVVHGAGDGQFGHGSGGAVHSSPPSVGAGILTPGDGSTVGGASDGGGGEASSRPAAAVGRVSAADLAEVSRGLAAACAGKYRSAGRVEPGGAGRLLTAEECGLAMCALERLADESVSESGEAEARRLAEVLAVCDVTVVQRGGTGLGVPF